MVNYRDARTALAEIEVGISNLATSEGWTAYLETAAKFHNYSLNNLMLIALQKPDATRVAGYRTWQSFGRQVRKGENGIRILAPMIGQERNDNGETTGESRVYGFKTVAVFDLSQTDGDEIPEAPVERLRGEAPEGLMKRLIEYGKEIGFETGFVPDLGGANGSTYFAGVNRIQILNTNDQLQQVKTMAHELGHALLHADNTNQLSRAQKELEAESVAFVVCRALGVVSDDYSFGYVLTWAGDDVEATTLLRASASRIVKAADAIIKFLERIEESQKETAA